MAERKWGAITSGVTFESLATTVVFFEDPNAALFGRRGKDGGQDARSGDGTRVFQAKHHENGSAAAAIRDAKSEAEKIEKYRQPSHGRYKQWKSVTHWRLVTNSAFNPTDKQIWDAEVVPLFAKQGLVADYWERENLNALLDKHPEIHRSFFENETRAFLSLPEVKERLPHQEPFLRREELGPFCGRELEFSKIREFLASPHLFLVVHGAGGMGKTRLLIEAGEMLMSEGEWQVLWANVASMAATGAWFESVVPERATLLLIDEPSDESILQQLAEQLGGRVGRTARWKMAVAVRSPKDPVLRFLRGARMKPRVWELPIAALPSTDAERMCAALLETGPLGKLSEDDRRQTAHTLSRRFSRHPVWLTLAVQHIEDHGNLKQIPANAKDLADEYIHEIMRSQSDSSPESVRDLLRWVALVGTVNREDDATIKMIGEGSGAGTVVEVQRKLASLVGRRVLIERGAHNRFVELKPDVLRDHVLLNWLSADVGFGNQPIVASEDARALLETVRSAALRGPLNGLGRAILVSLARTEFLLRLSGYDLQLFAGFFGALEEAVPTMTASQRLALAGVLEIIAPFHPRAAASLSMTMRRTPTLDETFEGIFGPKIVGQSDIVLALAWPLFQGAMGAESADDREVLLRELCALAEAEAELAPRLKRGLPNDGKRADALVKRVLEGGPQFWSEFDETAKQLGIELLTELTQRPPTLGQTALLKALVQPVVALERRQTWNDEHAFHIQTFAIGPEHSAWAARRELLDQVKAALSSDSTPLESRIQLWHVLAEAHRNINQLCRRGRSDQYYAPLLDDLVWAYQALARRHASMEELGAARKIWDWHRRFESDPNLKDASIKLENLYATNELAKEFEPLLSHDDWEQKGTRAAAKGAKLASASKPEEITSFIDRAISFFGQDDKLHSLTDVAWSLGEHAATSDIVRLFVKDCLKQSSVSPRSNFGVTTAVSWVASVRKGDHPERAHVLVTELMAACGSDNQRANLLLHIYGRVPKLREVGDFTVDEHALMRRAGPLFTSTGHGAAFLAALALTLEHNWATLRPLLEEVLLAISPDRQPQAVRGLIDAVYWAVREANVAQLPKDLAKWLLSQLLLLPDFDDFGDNEEWHLEEILKRIGYVDVSWLPSALKHRRDQEAMQRGENTARAVSYHARISKYVRRITASDVNEIEVTKALDALLSFVSDNGSVGYHLPEVLHDVDPEGLLVPAAVETRLQADVEPELVRRLARIGRAYAVGSGPWRIIAKAAIRAGMPHGSEILRSIFGALDEQGVQSWSGTLGEVPVIFMRAVDAAQTALKAEADEDLRPFWQYRLIIAEADLHEQEERAKEERGE
ncbi:hypothetical protein [Cystobacter fuscus]|uniref:hypothetical protein n=1 Tax=Cystobacter fuscus TaxID=43 RepID=UPI0037C0F7FE